MCDLSPSFLSGLLERCGETPRRPAGSAADASAANEAWSQVIRETALAQRASLDGELQSLLLSPGAEPHAPLQLRWFALGCPPGLRWQLWQRLLQLEALPLSLEEQIASLDPKAKPQRLAERLASPIEGGEALLLADVRGALRRALAPADADAADADADADAAHAHADAADAHGGLVTPPRFEPPAALLAQLDDELSTELGLLLKGLGRPYTPALGLAELGAPLILLAIRDAAFNEGILSVDAVSLSRLIALRGARWFLPMTNAERKRAYRSL